MAMLSLNEEERNWIIEQIRQKKESEYIGDDRGNVLENWDIFDFDDISLEEMDFLEGLYKTVR